jgi:hypothetical protein
LPRPPSPSDRSSSQLLSETHHLIKSPQSKPILCILAINNQFLASVKKQSDLRTSISYPSSNQLRASA